MVIGISLELWAYIAIMWIVSATFHKLVVIHRANSCIELKKIVSIPVFNL